MVGNTPLVEIPAMSPKPSVHLYAKLEGQNPTGSVKDRIAKFMIEDAERSGRLRPGQTILEPTSGNTGIALALVGRLKGYPVKVVMPDAVSPERVELLLAFGAEIIYSPGDLGTNGSVAMAREVAAEHPDWFMPFQYENLQNPGAHYHSTAPEIIADLPQVTHFVAGLGTSGTFIGAGRRLREFKRDIVLASVQPDSPLHGLEGLKHMESAIVPGIYDATLADEDVRVGTEESYEMTRRLAQEEGLLVGISSGANLAGALKIAGKDSVVVVVFCDGGERYLSERFWENPPEGTLVGGTN
jgi:cysteine synthase B